MLIDSGMSSIVLSDADGGLITLSLEGTDVWLEPTWNGDGSLGYVDVNVSARAKLIEVSQYHDTADHELLDLFGRLLSQELERRFTNLLSMENQFRADFLGLGDMLRDRDAQRFDAMPQSWNELLGNVDFHVNVSAKVGRTSDLKSSVSVDGEGEFGDSGQ